MRDIDYVKEFIAEEVAAVQALQQALTDDFEQAVEWIYKTPGRVIVTGVGKSGHIGKKIAATFSSTGTHAFFVHPSEASHGDLGMIANDDIVLALSKSGESHELSDIIHFCKRYNLKLIAITQQPRSALGKAADCILRLPELKEAGPYGLAPTTSTTLSIILGDALALCCMRRRSFSPQQFRRFHPGGKLGQKLSKASDVMHAQSLPLVTAGTAVLDASVVMSQGLMGCVGVVNDAGELCGIFTDGDLRRNLPMTSRATKIGDVMTQNPQMASPDALISEIAHLFSAKKISSVFICDGKKPVGIVHVQDLLRNNYI